MLTSLILQLQSPTTATLPANLGQATQSLLLCLMGASDADLARELHTGEGPKPFTVSNLVLGKPAKGSLRIEAGQVGWLRLTGLTEAVGERLLALAAKPPAMVEMDSHHLAVTGVTLDFAVHP
jgi:CRISPR/Cas system endoribonuclease Cas6 (RAMP superfamily)